MTQYLDYEGLKAFAETIDDKFVRKDGLDTTFAEVVDSLPTDITKIKKHLYLVKDSTVSQNLYAEYIYIGEVGEGQTYDASKWEKLGDFQASVDLADYVKKADAIKSIRQQTSASGIDQQVYLTVTLANGEKTDIPIGAASTTMAGVMSKEMFDKLKGIATGANKTEVDSALSSTSTNPVQNKVVNTALGQKSAKTETVNAISAATASATAVTGNYTKADGTSGTFAIPTATTALAGVMSGADKKALDTLKNRYPLSIGSFTASPSLLEVGASSDVTFTWSLGNTDFHESYTQGIVVDGAASVAVTKGTLTYKKTALAGATSATTKSATISITETGKSAITKSVSITYHYPTYIGVVANGTSVTESVVKGLTKSIEWGKGKTATLEQTNQLIVYAYPKSYGTLTSIKDGNGFEGIGGYAVSTIQVGGQDYYVYVQKLPATASSKYTFA